MKLTRYYRLMSPAEVAGVGVAIRSLIPFAAASIRAFSIHYVASRSAPQVGVAVGASVEAGACPQHLLSATAGCGRTTKRSAFRTD